MQDDVAELEAAWREEDEIRGAALDAYRASIDRLGRLTDAMNAAKSRQAAGGAAPPAPAADPVKPIKWREFL